MMQVRNMTLSDLGMVLGWAQDEGWNPGRSDAAAFWAADPGGFFLADVDGTPAAAISVVNHSAEHAFLGLYICRPAFRGQGYGKALWDAALRHAGSRSVTLEGVPDQQDNYRRSGFQHLGTTVRYRIRLAHAPVTSRTMTSSVTDQMMALDAKAVGYTRPAFASSWFAGGVDRQTIVLPDVDQELAFATYRLCADGAKIGPLYAHTPQHARALLHAEPFEQHGDTFIDVPQDCAPLSELVQELGGVPVFETARMVRGLAACAHPPLFHSVCTLELG